MTKLSPLALLNTGFRTRLATAFEYAATAVCLGLVAGTISVLFWLYGSYQDNFVGWNTHKLWMPLASEPLFVALLLGLVSPLALVLPRRSFDFIVAGLAVFTAAFGVLITPGVLHVGAVVLLSLGLAFKAGRFFQEHSKKVRRVCRFVGPLGLIAVSAMAGSVNASRSWREQSTIAELPPAPANAPNVLFVVWDTVRADYVGTFAEDGAPTPHLDQLAKRGVAFDLAISTAPWTLPSHTSMFTGKFPNEFAASWYIPIEQDEVLLAEVLQNHGYQTGGFVANTVYCGRGVGMDQGFAHYEDEPSNATPQTFYNSNFFFHLATQNFAADDRLPPGDVITDRCMHWLESTRRDRPFFAFLNYMDAHTPYLPDSIDGRPLTAEEIAKMRTYERLDPENVSPADRELAQKCYRAEITKLDAELGRLLDYLKQRDALKKTVVVVVSDHGEHFGEQGLYLHGNSLYQPLVHVPLVIARPEEPLAGHRVMQSVSTRNLAATVLECARVPREPAIRGQSLLQVAAAKDQPTPIDAGPIYASNTLEGLKNNTRHSNLMVFEKSPNWQGKLELWVDHNFFLLRGPQESTELYDVARDPQQEVNLTETPASQPQFQRMQTQLQRFLENPESADPSSHQKSTGKK